MGGGGGRQLRAGPLPQPLPGRHQGEVRSEVGGRSQAQAKVFGPMETRTPGQARPPRERVPARPPARPPRGPPRPAPPAGRGSSVPSPAAHPGGPRPPLSPFSSRLSAAMAALRLPPPPPPLPGRESRGRRSRGRRRTGPSVSPSVRRARALRPDLRTPGLRRAPCHPSPSPPFPPFPPASGRPRASGFLLGRGHHHRDKGEEGEETQMATAGGAKMEPASCLKQSRSRNALRCLRSVPLAERHRGRAEEAGRGEAWGGVASARRPAPRSLDVQGPSLLPRAEEHAIFGVCGSAP